MQQLSATDASFVYTETPRTPMHIGSVAIYDPSTAPGGFVRFKDILSFIEGRLGGARAFRQRLIRVPLDLDHPYWIEDPEFDLEFHVRHIALPKPGDWRQLAIQAARIHARPLDMTKPLWEFTVVEGLDNIEGLPPGCFALISKIHHAAIDGVSGVELTSAIHDLDADMRTPEKPDTWRPENMPRVAELLSRSYVNSLIHPFRVAETLSRSLPGMNRLGEELRRGRVKLNTNRPVPRTRLNGKVGAHRVWDAAFFPLADIRAIKNAVPGATVNDVVLSMVGGGLRAYLQAHNDLPKETLMAMAPISVRTADQKSDMGNQVSAMVVGLGTQIEDPLERLRFVHEEATNSKAMTNAVGAKTLSEYSTMMPAALAGLGARLYTDLGLVDTHAPTFNCVVTNVPGPPVPLYFCGARMVRMAGTGPVFDGMGLINAVYSYAGELAIAPTADRDLMPDPWVYTDGLRSTFEALKAKIAPTPTPADAVDDASRARVRPASAHAGSASSQAETRHHQPGAS